MLRVLFYFTLLIGVAAYALWRGRRDERIAALTCVAASLGSFALLVSHPSDYASLEQGVAVIDFAALVAFTWIALKSNRFWPLWVAGLQLTSIMGHALKYSDSSMLPVVYATSLASWSYVILLIIAFGTWRGDRSRATA
ncbi:MAG: hypothetical protein ABI626_06215 [Sphingomicrobium sp.]